MDGPKADPMHWGVDDVVKELSALTRPCTSSLSTLPDIIRNNGLDGEVLLTYDCAGYGDDEALRENLLKVLEANTISQRHSLGAFIVQMRAASPLFQARKATNSRDLSQDVPVSDVPTADDAALGVADQVAKAPKKKRVSPQLIQKSEIQTPMKLPEESGASADTWLNGQGDSLQWDQANRLAYLGEGQMTKFDIRSPDTRLSVQVQEQDGILRTHVPTILPTGRRLAVHRTLKRLLLKNGRQQGAVHGFGVWDSDISSHGDEILDFNTLPDEFDEQTLKEIEEEEEEEKAARGKQEAACPRYIDRDRVQCIVDEELADMKARWYERKLPKYQQKSFHIWRTAAQRGVRNSQAVDARRRAKGYGDRIRRIVDEILHQSWEKESDIRFQAKCVEQSLEDKLHQSWLADMLESRTEPPRPKTPPKLPYRYRKQQRCDSDSEILTSSDEDGFVVPDEHATSSSVLEHARPFTPASERYQTRDNVDVESPSAFMDLTQMESPYCLKRGDVDPFVDLTSPTKNGATNIDSTSLRNGMPLGDCKHVETFKEHPASHWAKENDRLRLTAAVLWQFRHRQRTAIFRTIEEHSPDEVFSMTIGKQLSKTPTKSETLVLDMTRLFSSFIKVRLSKTKQIISLSSQDAAKLEANKTHLWPTFCKFLSRIEPLFPKDSQVYRADESDEELLAEGDDEELLPEEATPSNNHRKAAAKEVIRDKEALDLREREKLRAEERERRRQQFAASLGIGKDDKKSPTASEKLQVIINDDKHADQSFIYVDELIAPLIKDHQIEGVRFMWSQVVQESKVRQGCLLAHSMGLGKTMQVVTFLVAIQGAAQSSDPSVSSQIPKDLRPSKTLVICPPGLVSNWLEELAAWDKGEILGTVHKVVSKLSVTERLSTIDEWSQYGGVLVIGYAMLIKVCGDETAATALYETPNIVVADEAHNLKNPTAKAHRCCAQFTARARIAMTGSPLANNVEEYYFMINWVAPNYLGPFDEFSSIYAQPIQHGLWHDSDEHERRTAVKMLQALKQIVEPKVHRVTTKSCLKRDLPPKQEFVICVSPTPLQMRLYNIFISAVREDFMKLQNGAGLQGKMFGLANNLGLLCNHPLCFRQKALEVKQNAACNQGDKDDDAEGKQTSFPARIVPELLTIFDEMVDSALDDPCLSVKVDLLVQILNQAKACNDKVLLFSQSIPTLDYLAMLLESQGRLFCRLDGSTDIQKRQAQTKRFNSDDSEIYLISTNAGGVGLNIQGANRVVIFDFKWNPVNEQQAVGRAYRIGQTKPVAVYYFVTAGTFEEDLHNKAVFKVQLASRVVDSKNPVSWSKRLGDITHDVKDVDELASKDLGDFVGKDAVLDKLIEYARDSQKIRHIMSTDTFEEEDTGLKLTDEERKEANAMVSRNKLRVTDPEAYRRQIE